MHASVLKYLREVARRGSVRKAAQALNVASSAINRQILKAEAELGIKLFDRLPEGMRLTPSGEVLLRHVRDTLHDYDRSLGEIDGIRGIKSGHIRIVALDSLLVEFLPTALDRFARRYPAVTFSVSARSPIEVFHAVMKGDADIGMSFVSAVSPTLQLVGDVPMPIGAVMAPSHPLARRKVLKLADVAPHPALLQEDTLPAAPFIGDEFAAFRHGLNARVTSNAIGFVKRLILSGLGVAFYTRLGFLREIAARELVWIPLATRRLAELKLGLYVPAQRTLSPACNSLVDDLMKRLERI